MSTATLDVAAVRGRFSALDRPLAFFDGPGGTQCPDEVIDAISAYLRESSANSGGPFETSRRTDELTEEARARAASFLGCTSEEVVFGPSMTALNFRLSRALARTLQPGDEIVVTKLDHDANVSPWLELAHDLGIVVRTAGVTGDLELDYEDLAGLVSERTRVVAFPVAANSVGTTPDVQRIVGLAHDAGALAWADAVHWAPHGPIDVGAWDVDVLICSPYKFYGPHLGLALRTPRAARVVAAVQGAPGARPPARAPVRARHVAVRAPRRLRGGRRLRRLDRLGRDPHARAGARRARPGRTPRRGRAVRPRDDGGTRSHLLLQRAGTVAGRGGDVPRRARPRGVARQLLRARDHAASRSRRRAVRAGIVHYNTEDEVDRLLEALGELL